MVAAIAAAHTTYQWLRLLCLTLKKKHYVQVVGLPASVLLCGKRVLIGFAGKRGGEALNLSLRSKRFT